MKKLVPLILCLVGITHAAEPLDPAQITATLKRVADWQLANPNHTNLREWVIAPLYDGLIDVSETTGDPKYLAAVIRMGIQSGWEPGNAFYFADEHAVGHAWLDIYMMDPSQKLRLDPFKKRLDAILAKPITEKLVGGQTPKTPGVGATDRWTWCDALYMG
ncbi:MAG: glycoside hydrolase family 88 protein, partial [Chthoniobacterales bacterium]